jgi:hypothetical protein
MTAWRTNPDLPLSSASDLAEKLKDLGRRGSTDPNNTEFAKKLYEVCQRLAPQHIKALDRILRIATPVRKSKKPPAARTL